MKAVMYHYVRPAPERLPFFRYLHVEDFERQLDWLGGNLGFVTREAFQRALQDGRPPEGVLLTFDDGLSDHFEHVLPALARRGLFGFFYLCTAPYRTGRLLDVHRIHLLLGRLGGEAALGRLSRHLREDMLGDGHVREFREATYRHQDNDEATTAFKRTLNYLISYEHREPILDALFAEEFGDERAVAERFYLDAEQIRALDAAGMVVGGHGVNHYVFSKLPLEAQRVEIAQSTGDLAAILGHPVRSFCYPYGGRHTYTGETVALLEAAGSDYCFAVEPRDITGADLVSARQALPRYDCNMFAHGRASLGPARPRQAA